MLVKLDDKWVDIVQGWESGRRLMRPSRKPHDNSASASERGGTVLVKLEEKWVDLSQVEYALGMDPDETGEGGLTHFRGESGFLRLSTAEGQPVLVNSRYVAELCADGEGTELTTSRGEKLALRGQPEWVADIINRARRYVGIVA